MHWLFTILTTLFLNNGYGQTISVTGDNPMKKWDKITVNLTLPSNVSESNSSFRNNRLDVIFTAPSGTKIRVPGFFAADGDAANSNAKSGNQYKAYLRPNEIGNWTYQALFYSGTDVALKDVNQLPAPTYDLSGAVGNVTTSNVGLPDLRFKGRLMYQTTGTSNQRRYLKWAETGEYFLKLGPDSPENLLNYDEFDHDVVNKKTCTLCTEHSFNPHAGNWSQGDPTWDGGKGKNLIGAVNYLRDQQMNSMSMSLYGGDDKNVFPWINDTSKYQYDVSKLAQWEIVFDHAEKNGLALHFKLAEAENWSKLDLNQIKIYYREMVARFGHHLAIEWNISEEFGSKDNTDASLAIPRINWLASIDPWQSHRVFHTYPGKHELYYNYLINNNAKITGASIQSSRGQNYDDAYDGKSGYLTWINASKNAGKPWVVASDEQNSGGEGVFVSRDLSNKSVKAEARKKILWKGLIAGGAGVMWYGGAEGDFQTENFDRFSTLFDWTKIAIQQFFEGNGIEYWKMQNNDALASGNLNRCLAEKGKVYVIYLENGGTTNVDLTGQSGTFEVKWFNPRAGGSLTNGSVTSVAGNGVQSIGNPPNNTTSDWVALVRLPSNIQIPVAAFSITPETAVLDKGTSKTIGRFFSPANATNKNITWTSSDPTVATVDTEGVVTAIKVGTTTITATTQDGNFTDTSEITVVYYPVTAFSITNATAKVIKGKTTTLANSFTPANASNKKITWVSSDPTIATVDVNGLITALKEGTVTITATSQDGNFSDTLTLTVDPEPTATIGNCSFEEQNGLLVIEAESAVDYDQALFTLETENVNGKDSEGNPVISVPTGNGYLRYTGPNHLGAQVAEHTIGYKIKINNPGTYQFLWRNIRDPKAATGDANNDAWLNITGGNVRFFGKKAGVEYTLTKHTKLWVQKSQFVYECYGETNSGGKHINGMSIWATFPTAGEYIIEYGGRSNGHSVDRLVLFTPNQAATAKNVNTPESNKLGEDCETVSPPPTTCSNVTMNAVDFPLTKVGDFVQAYVHTQKNALAINAAQHKDVFAAVKQAFTGEDGTYDITITTLAELDGESSYVLKVGGTTIGTYQNPETDVDYTPTTKTWEGIEVKKGDEIQVEFNSHTNGKIPENGGTAFSRGRWTKIEFTCEEEDNPPPPLPEVATFHEFPTQFGNESNTYSFKVKYSSNEARDLLVHVKSPGNVNISNAKIVVSPGQDQIATVNVTVPAQLDPAEKYKFVVSLRPIGGGFATNLSIQIKFSDIIAGSLSDDRPLKAMVKTYPNPIGNANFNIEVDYLSNNLSFIITDLNGRIIRSEKITNTLTIIPSSIFPSRGVYILKISDGDGGTLIKKLIK